MIETSNVVIIVNIILIIAIITILTIVVLESNRFACGLVGNEKKFFRKSRLTNVMLVFIFICLFVINILFTNGENLICLLYMMVSFIASIVLIMSNYSKFSYIELKAMITPLLIGIFVIFFCTFGVELNSLAFSKIDVKDCDFLYSRISQFVEFEEDRCIKYEDINGNVKTTSKPATLVYCYDSTDPDNSGRYYYFSKTYNDFMDMSADNVKLEFIDTDKPYYSKTRKVYKYNLYEGNMLYIYILRYEKAIFVPEDQVVKIDLSKNT